MRVCGIDPGLTGGITFIEGEEVSAERTPVTTIAGKKYLDLTKIVNRLVIYKPKMVYIEKQQAMPRQGVSSTFKTGFNYGLYLGLFTALNIDYKQVSSRKWKKDLNISADKDLARANLSTTPSRTLLGVEVRRWGSGIGIDSLLGLELRPRAVRIKHRVLSKFIFDSFYPVGSRVVRYFTKQIVLKH